MRFLNIAHLASESDPAEGEELLDRIAAQVIRRGLVTPAIFFIEMNRPLSFLAGQATHTLFPFLAPLFGVETTRLVARLLDDSASVDRLLERIERAAVPSEMATYQHGAGEPRLGRGADSGGGRAPGGTRRGTGGMGEAE